MIRFQELAVLLLLALLLACVPAEASLSPADLASIVVVPSANAHLPGDAQVFDEDGRSRTFGESVARHPVSIVLFVDYTCESVCGTALAIAASSLTDPSLADLDVGLIVIGIDPKDGIEEAKRQRRETPNEAALGSRAVFLTADVASVERLTRSVGYAYRYDPERDQFAHPAAALFVDASGALARVASSLSLSAEPLRLSLIDVGKGRIGGLLDRIRLRCYAYDPVSGLYTSRIRGLLRFGATFTVLALGLGIALLVRAGGRRRESAS